MATIVIPTFNQDRGPRLFSTITGSSVAVPTNYCESQCIDTGDGCVETQYDVRSIDISINELINCRATNVGVASLKTRLDADYAEVASYEAIINYLRDQIKGLTSKCV